MATSISQQSFRCLKQGDVVTELRDSSIPCHKNDVCIKYMLSRKKNDTRHDGDKQASV